MEGIQRYQLFENLLNAVWPRPSDDDESILGTFAAYDAVKYSEGFILKSFHVEGAGELQLPLSAEDAAKLRSVCEQAPFGKGFDTVVDTNVRRCWQVDASKICFPEMPTFVPDTLQRLAVRAVRALGVVDGPEVQLEAHLYKLLFYEAGGHFTFHRDTEKEKGMFATLILQLPTEDGYTGGELVVKYHNQVKQIDCHLVSALGYCYTVFFADCMHELRKIASGTKLCLAFNLVKQDSSLDTARRLLISSRVHKAEAALEPWLEEATEGKLKVFSGKLAIPLKHKYTATNLSFARLKGDDRIVAEVLKDCRDKKKEKWLDLHLCLVSKYQEGLATDHDIMWQVREEVTEFENWIDFDGNPIGVAFKNLRIDLESEVVLGEGGDPFKSEPDEKRYEAHTGNDGPNLEYWYHRAMLVAWPKAISASIACEANVSGALDILEIKLKENDPDFLVQLRQVVRYCGKHAFKVWRGDCSEDPVTPALVSLCSTRVRVLDDVLYILQLLGKVHYRRASLNYGVHGKEDIIKVGVRTAEVAKAIATVVHIFGWEVLSADIINLVKEFALTRGESLAELAKQLICKGNNDAGAAVASTMFEILESRIAELESHKKPEFTWCQPLAKLPAYPHIESFLKGPHEKYVHKGARSLHAAKLIVARFSYRYRDCGSRSNSASAWYSATGTPSYEGHGYSATGTLSYQGHGRVPFIVIQKRRRLFEVAMEIWCKEQEEIKRLRLGLGQARLAVPQTEIVALTTFTDGSGQGGRKRHRLDTKVGDVKS